MFRGLAFMVSGMQVPFCKSRRACAPSVRVHATLARSPGRYRTDLGHRPISCYLCMQVGIFLLMYMCIYIYIYV